jgi:hypothetical protein
VAAALCVAGMARADMVFDASSQAGATATTINLNHTIGGGADRLLVVCVAVEGTTGNADLTAPPTYDGTAMTKAIDRTGGTSYDMNTEIWYLLDAQLPPAGTYQVTVQAAGADDISVIATSVSGAAQQGPEATAGSDDGQTGQSTIQTQITTITDKAWIFDVAGTGNAMSGLTPDAGQTERGDVGAGSSRGAVSTEEKATAGLETQGWTTDGGSNRLVHAVAAFASTQSINHRSIGTNPGPLALAGTASVASGSRVVTFSGVTLPTNIGLGDRLTIDSTGASIALDNVSSRRWTSNVATATVNHAIGAGANRLLVVCISHEAFPPLAVAGCTYNGVPMTLAGIQEGHTSTLGNRNETWYMLEANLPPAGTYPVAVQLSAAEAPGIGVISLTGVAQQGPEAMAGSQCAACATTQANITTLTDGAWVISTVGNGSSGTYTGHGPGQTEHWDHAPSSCVHSGTTRMVATAGPVTIFETASTNANRQSQHVTAWAPAPSGSETFYVLSRDSDTQVTVQGTSPLTLTNAGYTIERAYNTLQAWEDDRDGDLVGEARLEVGVCYNDGPFTDPLTIRGSTTDAAHYLTLTVAEGERHDGTEDSGAIIDACCASTSKDMGQHLILVEDQYTRIEWLQFARTEIGDYSAIYFSDSPSGANGRVSHVMAYAGWLNGNLSGVRVMAPNVTVRNSIFRASGVNGVSVGNAGASVTIENCTIYGCTQGIKAGAGTDVTVRNTISVGNSVSDCSVWGTVSYFGYNLFDTSSGFDPALYQGNNHRSPVDLETLFLSLSGSYDLHLEPAGHKAVNEGLDLSGDFSDDIDEETRSGPWDIGADHIPPNPRVLTWQEVEPD